MATRARTPGRGNSKGLNLRIGLADSTWVERRVPHVLRGVQESAFRVSGVLRTLAPSMRCRISWRRAPECRAFGVKHVSSEAASQVQLLSRFDSTVQGFRAFGVYVSIIYGVNLVANRFFQLFPQDSFKCHHGFCPLYAADALNPKT